jgi:hypothetical protein
MGSSPSVPATPEVQAAPQEQDAAVVDARDEETRRRRAAAGRSSTLLTVRNIQSVFLVVRTSPVVMSARNYSSLIPELILILAMRCQKNYVATLFL